MSIPDAHATGQQAGRPSQAAACHSHLSDLFRIRRMERLLKHALGELEQVKARVTQLENEIAIQNSVASGMGKASDMQLLENAAPAISIPIAEMRQLAEMAKRFR